MERKRYFHLGFNQMIGSSFLQNIETIRKLLIKTMKGIFNSEKAFQRFQSTGTDSQRAQAHRLKGKKRDLVVFG